MIGRLLCTMRGPVRDEREVWKAVARETMRVFDGDFLLCGSGLSRQEGGRVAVEHLCVGRTLMQPIIDRYIAEARTPYGRAWRRWGAERGPYVQAFNEALANATARAGGGEEPGGDRGCGPATADCT